jgi:DNA-binding beta-propeller fold protein YncE
MKPFLSICLLLAYAIAATGQRPALLVVNQGDHNLSFIDPVSKRQLDAVDVDGITGHEVGLSGDGRFAFVPIYGNSGVGKPGTDGRTIAVIDTHTHKLVKTIDFGHGVRPHCVVYDSKRDLIYISTELDRSIAILDPHSFKILGQIPTGQDQSHMLALSHDGRFGYTANVGPGTVSVLDMQAHKTLKIIPISADTQRISISNDDRSVFTADQTRPQLAVIDTATNTLKTWIPLPGIGYGTALTPDGQWLLVALRTTGKVAVVDLRTLEVARVLDAVGIPTEIIIPPGSNTAYVSCGKKVAAIDLTNWHVDLTIEAGDGADGLAWLR